MITLQEVLDEQKDLPKLCAKRGNPTIDAFHGNGYYGVADIYKTYAEVPLNKPLNGIVPHGVGFDPKWVWSGAAKANVPYIYCYPDHCQKQYKRDTNKKVILSASPFVYVMEMLKNQPKPERRGTLFLPLHSTRFVIIQQDYEELANLLLTFDEKYQPVHVCIYWRDRLLGAAKPFQSKGIPVVSAGHMFDRLFMYRLYHLFSQYQYTSSNLQSNSLLYGVKAGCTFFHTRLPFKPVASARILKRDAGNINTKHMTKLGRAFAPRSDTTGAFLWEERNDTTTPEQKRLVDYYLGTAHLKTKKQMRHDMSLT